MSYDDDNAWNDLFTKASEQPTKFLEKVSHESEGRNNNKKRKREKGEQKNEQKFRQMLASRMNTQLILNGKNFSDDGQWQMIAYSSLLSLRSRAYALATGATKNHIDQKDIQRISVAAFPSKLDQGELELLRNKLEHLKECITLSRHSPSFDTWVRIIIACDDLYLRIYYLQTSGSLQQPYIPHPAQYFTSKIDQSAEYKKLRKLTKKKYDVRALFGIDEEEGHILFAIYRKRMHESWELFQSHKLSGSDSQKILKQPNKSPSSSLAYHETPAAPILKEWRDSCRDVLCNLLCYACVAPSTLSFLSNELKKNGIDKIIELGAGTGYLAKIFEEVGLSVKAYDINPSCDHFNDYHGKTQPFTTVQTGTHSNVLHKSIPQSTALLLCYPPPNCTMAYDSAKRFMKVGGNCLIHVGEWKGMTGSKQFEELLVKDFKCIYRAPCPTWGTDAASVSVWKKCDSIGKTGEVLLPCIACGNHEAKRRCRLIRYAVYCSEDCFKNHASEFQLLCQLSLIPAQLYENLSFVDNLHFQPL